MALPDSPAPTSRTPSGVVTASERGPGKISVDLLTAGASSIDPREAAWAEISMARASAVRRDLNRPPPPAPRSVSSAAPRRTQR